MTHDDINLAALRADYMRPYRDLTLQIYNSYLDRYLSWCADQNIDPLRVTRRALEAGATLRKVQDLARHADPKTTMNYHRNRTNLDDHAVHSLVAFLAPNDE